MRYDSGRSTIVDDQIHGFKVNIKPEKKSKLSSVVLKIRGIDQVNILILSFHDLICALTCVSLSIN